MRRSIPVLILLLATTASCGQQQRQQESMAPESAPATQAFESADQAPQAATSRAAVGPNVGPTAAPGVAFNYRYAFRLAAPRIAEVQEQHAQLCERLTVARCRITGLRYRVVNERDIEAMLAFRLDPAIARRFGREGVEAVARAEGMLTESEITGTDAASGIRQAGRSIAQMTEELRRIEARLAARPSADERIRLEGDADRLRQGIRAAEAGREEQADSLATTPMVFNYGSGDLVPGFDSEMTFAKSWRQALDNVSVAGLGLMIILVTLAPWILLGLLLWWAVLRIRRRWFAKPPVEAA
jgi:Domain of unknown function (DUF4349)